MEMKCHTKHCKGKPLYKLVADYDYFIKNSKRALKYSCAACCDQMKAEVTCHQWVTL